MDNGACNIIYLDRRAAERVVRKDELPHYDARKTSIDGSSPGYFTPARTPEESEVYCNTEIILTVFPEVGICNSGASCIRKLSEIGPFPPDNTPTVVIIDIAFDEEQRLRRLSREPRTPSPTSFRRTTTDAQELDDLYGMHLLQHITSEIQQKNLSRLVVPVVMLSGVNRATSHLASPNTYGFQASTDAVRLNRYLDAGAMDVFTSPISRDNVRSLLVHGYRARKEFAKDETNFLSAKRNRKVSWVGVDEAKPYAYLREAMVSGLMNGICNPESIGDSLDPNDVVVQDHRKAAVKRAVGTWDFAAHDFTDDELLYGALVMLEHALQMPELEQWRMDTDELLIFLLASRTAYNDFVKYHNFRHVTDVLQALFFFLVQIGTLPPYPDGEGQSERPPQPPIATILKPFDALTLLVSAIGHDVGHPGVNNAFLVALNSPLAQLYNDRSVLESFHCAAYSQLLRRYWPGAFADMAMRKLMINSILATDMGLHFKYMTDLGNLQEKLSHNKGSLDGWNAKTLEEYKELICGLLIKCADISNVARKFDTAKNWALILMDEFHRQGDMEQDLRMPTCLFGGPPVKGDLIKLGESQIGFMNIFAQPLFEGVADVLPAMSFSTEEIKNNKGTWQRKLEAERQTAKTDLLGGDLRMSEAAPSPRTEVPPVLQTTERVTNSTACDSSPTYFQTGAAQISVTAASSSSRRSSVGVMSMSEKGSRRSSAAGIAAARTVSQAENASQSRRGSADASLTVISVTQQSSQPPETPKKGRSSSKGSENRSKSQSKRFGRKANNEESAYVHRPTTAPSPFGAHAHSEPNDLSAAPAVPAIRSQSYSDPSLTPDGSGDADANSQRVDGQSQPSEDSERWTAADKNGKKFAANNQIRTPRSANRWTSSSWRNRGRSGENISVSDPAEKGGFLSAVPSPGSTSTNNEKMKGSSAFSKMLRKLRSNSDRERERGEQKEGLQARSSH